MNHEIYAITDVEIVAPYTLHLKFDDVTEQTINFSSVLNGEMFKPLQDLLLFNQVRLDDEIHTIVWPNGADFDPATLHDWNLYKTEIEERSREWAKVAEEQAEYECRTTI
jgi:DUF971 family protein